MESLSAPLPGPVVRAPVVAFRLVSDARLARLAAGGSEGAMAVIFERHHQALYRYCHSIVGNGHDAADALQNTMVKALGALRGERRQIELRAWLYRIAHNESVSLLRARRSDCDLDAVVGVGDAAAAGVVESRERLRSLTADLGELSERQRGALLMRELGGLAFSEVAEAQAISAAAAKQLVYEARCALQALREGREMDCEVLRRTLSDGDRRMLRGLRVRGHLRDCARCREFEVALRERPAQLAAIVSPLPVGVGAAMLHGLLGGGGAAGGGGLAAGVAGAVHGTGAMSVGAKALAAVALSASLAGGASYVVPRVGVDRPGRSTAPRTDIVAPAGAPSAMPTAWIAAVRRQRGQIDARLPAQRPRLGERTSAPPTAAAMPTATASAQHVRTRNGKPVGTPAGKPSHARTPNRAPGGKPAATPGGKPAQTPGSPTAKRGRPTGTPRTTRALGRP